MPVEENPAILGRWKKVQSTKEARRYIRIVLLLGLVVLLTAVVGCAGGGEDQADSAAPDTATTAEQAQQPPGGTAAGGESTLAGAQTTGALAKTGTITGRVTDEDSGEPVSDVYITVGWQDSQLAAITDADGRYTVPNVPAGEPAPVFGFHEGNYRYNNSAFHDDLNIMLKPGETFTYDFAVRQLDEPGGQPEVSDPSISSETTAPGETVTFGLTARGGEGGLSREIFAASPKLGRLVLLKTAGGDRFRAEFTIPVDTPPSDYPFAFFVASNACYDPEIFPMLTLHVT